MEASFRDQANGTTVYKELEKKEDEMNKGLYRQKRIGRVLLCNRRTEKSNMDMVATYIHPGTKQVAERKRA